MRVSKDSFVSCGLAVMAVVALSGCGKDKASFKVKLAPTTTALNAAAALESPSGSMSMLTAPTSIGIKLGGVDLIADCAGDNPPGTCLDDDREPDPDIWVNAGCNNDIAQCTTSNTEFFEMVDPTAANEALNSQGRTIEAGTFTQVRIYALNNDNGDALTCNSLTDSTARPGVPVTYKLPQALTVADGESVTVNLNYSTDGVDCSNMQSVVTMFSKMTVTVDKN